MTESRFGGHMRRERGDGESKRLSVTQWRVLIFPRPKSMNVLIPPVDSNWTTHPLPLTSLNQPELFSLEISNSALCGGPNYTAAPIERTKAA